jgi:hypothetical protein
VKRQPSGLELRDRHECRLFADKPHRFEAAVLVLPQPEFGVVKTEEVDERHECLGIEDVVGHFVVNDSQRVQDIGWNKDRRCHRASPPGERSGYVDATTAVKPCS